MCIWTTNFFYLCSHDKTKIDEHKALLIDGLVQEICNSIANALELHLSCTNPLICPVPYQRKCMNIFAYMFSAICMKGISYISMQKSCGTLSAEVAIFQDNYVISMAADALAPCITKTSVTTVLSM